MAGAVIPEPYSYPSRPHVRRHGPRGWDDYSKYLHWLRDEFAFRCVYCLERESWRDMRQRMHIDHFLPQSIYPNLKCEYANLLYACPACNSHKGKKLVADPCKIALGDCIRIDSSGRIEARNEDGERLIEILALDNPLTERHRSRIIGIIRSVARTDPQLLGHLMGFPEDLPNLSRFAPPQNDKSEGIAQSYYERRSRGELAQIY
jgi:HNH endonuclease